MTEQLLIFILTLNLNNHSMLGEIRTEEKVKSAIQKLVSHLLEYERDGWVRILRSYQEEFEKENFSRTDELMKMIDEDSEYKDLMITHLYKAEYEMEPREMLKANKLKKALAEELIKYISEL